MPQEETVANASAHTPGGSACRDGLIANVATVTPDGEWIRMRKAIRVPRMCHDVHRRLKTSIRTTHHHARPRHFINHAASEVSEPGILIITASPE
jgi:hypothetical protein